MNELEHDLENELRGLAPAAPPPHLAAAIDQALQPVVARRTSRSVRVALWTSWTLTAAAAGAAVIAWWPAVAQNTATSSQPPVATIEPAVVPVSSANVLYGANDEGIVVLDDGRAARKVRLHFVDTVQLRDRDAGASIAVSRPREEVRFVPVSFY